MKDHPCYMLSIQKGAKKEVFEKNFEILQFQNPEKQIKIPRSIEISLIHILLYFTLTVFGSYH